jgi:hypothetical protein
MLRQQIPRTSTSARASRRHSAPEFDNVPRRGRDDAVGLVSTAAMEGDQNFELGIGHGI